MPLRNCGPTVSSQVTDIDFAVSLRVILIVEQRHELVLRTTYEANEKHWRCECPNEIVPE